MDALLHHPISRRVSNAFESITELSYHSESIAHWLSRAVTHSESVTHVIEWVRLRFRIRITLQSNFNLWFPYQILWCMMLRKVTYQQSATEVCYRFIQFTFIRALSLGFPFSCVNSGRTMKTSEWHRKTSCNFGSETIQRDWNYPFSVFASDMFLYYMIL